MNRREFIALVAAAAPAGSVHAVAQTQPIPVIGFLSTGWPGPVATLLEAFKKSLRAAGLVEGRNIAIEYRWAEGRFDRLESLAAELVHRNVMVIAATGGTVAGKAARAATSKVPILFVAGFDPVREGLVDSINRPGGNATGVGVYTAELGKKRLEMLHNLVKRHPIAMLVNPNAVSTTAEIKDAREFASERGLTLYVLEAATGHEIDSGFAEAAGRGAAALFVSADSFFTNERVRIVALANRYKLPVCYPWPLYVKAGGLMSYGTDLEWAYEQVGIYAARILKGDKPGELPVVFPTKFATVVNLKTARDLGLIVPEDVISTADEVIE